MKLATIVAATLLLTACGSDSGTNPNDSAPSDQATSSDDGGVINDDDSTTGSSTAADNDANSGNDNNAGNDANSGNDNNAGNDANSGNDNNAGNDANSGNDNNAGNDANSGNDNNAGNDANSGNDNDSGNDANSGNDNDSGNDANSGNDNDSGNDANSGNDNDSGNDANSGNDNDSGNDANSDTDNNTDTDADADTVGDCTVPESGTTKVSKTTPVVTTGNSYYPDMGPQCVVPGSQFDGPGLRYGDFLLMNNAWNGQQSTADWEQCISITSAGGSVNPSWTFDWGNEDDLQPGLFEWEVKSFPEIIYGAKSSTELSAPCASTGLPVLMSDAPEISIAYNYRTTMTDERVGDKGDEANNPDPVTGGDRNIAIESFFHSSCDIQRGRNSNMELELMVWLEAGNERLPSGSAPEHTFTSATGQTYDVYTKPNNDQYIAYVAQNVVQAGTLDWSEFIDDTRSNATTYKLKSIQDNWCLANIIFGSEIWWGKGTVNLDYYQITSKY